jgi:hypothetical protein
MLGYVHGFLPVELSIILMAGHMLLFNFQVGNVLRGSILRFLIFYNELLLD